MFIIVCMYVHSLLVCVKRMRTRYIHTRYITAHAHTLARNVKVKCCCISSIPYAKRWPRCEWQDAMSDLLSLKLGALLSAVGVQHVLDRSQRVIQKRKNVITRGIVLPLGRRPERVAIALRSAPDATSRIISYRA